MKPCFHSHKEIWFLLKYLIDNLRNILAPWKSKCLSWDGRVTYVNSVIANIPNYTKSLFQLPRRELRTKETVSVGNFYGVNHRKVWLVMPPINWSKWCWPKSHHICNSPSKCPCHSTYILWILWNVKCPSWEFLLRPRVAAALSIPPSIELPLF